MKTLQRSRVWTESVCVGGLLMLTGKWGKPMKSCLPIKVEAYAPAPMPPAIG